MSNNNIKTEIINFYNDPLYQELNAYYSKKTIFNILKIERNENRHSAFLAWLLDKNINHGLGDEPLKKLLRFLYIRNEVNSYDSCLLSGNYLIDKLEVSTEEQAYDNKKYGRIDIFLKFQYRYHTGDEEEKKLCVIIENKMYTEEHDNQTERYRDWALRDYEKEQIIGVFLAPNRINECKGDSDVFKFLKIDYQDLLDNVLEPLLLLDMPQETRFIIQDYVINLEKPVGPIKDEEGKVIFKEETILSVSKTKENAFQKIFEAHSFLLNAAIFANAKKRKKTPELKKVYHNYQDFQELLNNDCELLESFWKSNISMLKMIMSSVLENNYNSDGEEDLSKAIDVLLEVKQNNRNYTKYVVKDKNGNIMNDKDEKGNSKPAFMSLASYYIFKAWLQTNENATLEELRKAFPVKQFAPHYNDTFQYLFYKYDDIHHALCHNKTGNTYFTVNEGENTILDEDNENTIKANKYLTWDFYLDDKHFLEVNNSENGKDKVLSIKYWIPREFERLVEYANKHGFSVEPQ